MTGGLSSYSQEQAGTPHAPPKVRAFGFSPVRVPTDPGAPLPRPRGQLLRFLLSRRTPHAAQPSSPWAVNWRALIGKCRSGFSFRRDVAKVRAGRTRHRGSRAGSAPGRRWFSEAEAQRLLLGPRLPHQRRHPLTADEALAGLILLAVSLAGLAYLIWRWL